MLGDSEYLDISAFVARRERVGTQLAAIPGGPTAYLATDQPNVRYLTGFAGTNAVALIDAVGRTWLGTDARYADVASALRERDPRLEVVLDRATLPALVDVAARHGHAAVAVADSLTLGQLVLVTAGSVRAVDDGGLLAALRQQKDAGECAVISQACHITVQALEAVTAEVVPGVSERWIARRIEQLFGDLGAEDRAFPTIVATGPNSAEPHHVASADTVAIGDLLIIDAGARLHGYCADMTRSFVVGVDPAPWQAEIADLVLAAQGAGRQACRPGAAAREVDQAARAVIADAGFGPLFGHGTGHGIGLDVHEAPMIGPRSMDTIGLGVPLTIEPGIYLPGRGGVRIEDTVLTAEHQAEVLTGAPHELRTIG